jgi:hypothetical protein
MPAVTHDRREGLSLVVEIEHDVLHALALQVVEHALDERPIAEGHGGFGHQAGQRIEARAAARGKDESGRHAASAESHVAG